MFDLDQFVASKQDPRTLIGQNRMLHRAISLPLARPSIQTALKVVWWWVVDHINICGAVLQIY